jgi:Mrp family chromosome partitioning ATPase
VKKVFPGNNTSLGFYSFYDHIITPDATRIMVIKGGPGVGKSTFMRTIATTLVDRGFDCEFHNCSSDNGSLDGVVFPQIGVALIDGTAPHVIDPKNPGCVDEIIHLGDFWDEKAIRANKREILAGNREIGRLFARAYRYLRAAQAVYEDWEEANTEAMDFGRANRIAYELTQELLEGRAISARTGRERRLFASAITPDGHINYLDTILQPCRSRYIIEGDPGTGKSTLLQKVANAAVERGCDVELYHCPLNPAKVEHVLIPALSVALTKSIEPHNYVPRPGDRVLDMNECLVPEIRARRTEVVASADRLFRLLFEQAISYIGLAKREHDRMETFYAPHMDFDGIGALREKTLRRILKYAEEKTQRTPAAT